jgi:chemotaxis protein histidine kinase CheA
LDRKLGDGNHEAYTDDLRSAILTLSSHVSVELEQDVKGILNDIIRLARAEAYARLKQIDEANAGKFEKAFIEILGIRRETATPSARPTSASTPSARPTTSSPSASTPSASLSKESEPKTVGKSKRLTYKEKLAEEEKEEKARKAQEKARKAEEKAPKAEKKAEPAKPQFSFSRRTPQTQYSVDVARLRQYFRDIGEVDIARELALIPRDELYLKRLGGRRRRTRRR